MSDAPEKIELRIQRLPHGQGLALPAYQTAGAAGMDLAAAVEETAPVVLAPGARALVPTGLAVAVPAGFEMQVRPRSGLAYKHGITVLNAPGTIDSDYRGEVQVMLVNHGEAAVEIRRGERKPSRVYKVGDPDPKAIRERLGLSQSRFAAIIGVSVRTLQNWEQGRREPEGPAKALLRVVDREPEAVLQALHA